MRLFLTSAALLYTELLLIRWVPAEVIYVGFFSNFILMGSFLGIGVGILYGRATASAGGRTDAGARRLPVPPFAVLLLAVVALIGTAKFDVQLVSPTDIFFGLAENSTSSDAIVVLPLVVALVTVVMASLATPLGGLLVSMPPLRAYTFDILGSLAGIAAFTILSALQTPPPVWFAVLAVGLALLGLGKGLPRRALPVAMAGLSAVAMVAVVGLSIAQLHGDIWSPYYRISVIRSPTWESINVNGIPHQSIALSTAPHAGLYYEQVYEWLPERTFKRVLVVGAGGGTDVQYALEHGAQHVDAVEIDPAILQLGYATNPGRPYQDPRVTTYTEDGRAFLRTSNAKYDLIIFALPDSLTLVSNTSNIRLESFLFTSEAFASVEQHLAPDGVFTLYNFYREGWLVQRLAGMLHDVFPGPILVHPYPQLNKEAASLAAGPGLATAARLPSVPAADIASASFLQQAPGPATDDWPFLYLLTPSIADYYLLALGTDPGLGARSGVGQRAPQRHLATALQPPLLRPGRRLPALGDAQPGDLQPALRDDLDRQLAGLLCHPAERAGGDPGRLTRARRRAPAGCTSPSSARSCSTTCCRRRACCSTHPGCATCSPPPWRSLPCSVPTSSSPTRSVTPARPTWRLPRTSSGRWSAACSSTPRSSRAIRRCSSSSARCTRWPTSSRAAGGC